MNQKEFFTLVLRILEDCRIPYMISGSVGAMLFSVPRMTNDMDVVVDLAPTQVDCIYQRLQGGPYYLPSKEFILTAIQRRGQFNIIHIESGSKVDLVIIQDTDFAKMEFSRKLVKSFTEGFSAFSATPEDIILSKMRYYQIRGSEKHIADILSIFEISGPTLDGVYLNRWVNRLGLEAVWELIQHKVKISAEDSNN